MFKDTIPEESAYVFECPACKDIIKVVPVELETTSEEEAQASEEPQQQQEETEEQTTIQEVPLKSKSPKRQRKQKQLVEV